MVDDEPCLGLRYVLSGAVDLWWPTLEPCADIFWKGDLILPCRSLPLSYPAFSMWHAGPYRPWKSTSYFDSCTVNLNAGSIFVRTRPTKCSKRTRIWPQLTLLLILSVIRALLCPKKLVRQAWESNIGVVYRWIRDDRVRWCSGLKGSKQRKAAG